MDPRISIITLGVSDLTRSTAFYRQAFGFPLLEDKSSPQISFFEVNKGSLWLALYPRHLLAEDALVADGPAGFAGFTLAHLVRSKPEVQSVFDAVVRAGARPVKPPQDVFWGGHSSYVADPDGFLWEIAFNPFSWIE